jgi:hypothetical protein
VTTMTATLALAAVPGAASAAVVDYSGSFHPSGALRFSLRPRDGHRFVTRFIFTQLPLDCAHGRNTETSSLSYDVRVKDRRFHTIGILGRHRHPRSELVLRGSITPFGRAFGTMRVFGSAVPVDDTSKGPRDRCDSGRLRWRAKRQR